MEPRPILNKRYQTLRHAITHEHKMIWKPDRFGDERCKYIIRRKTTYQIILLSAPPKSLLLSHQKICFLTLLCLSTSHSLKFFLIIKKRCHNFGMIWGRVQQVENIVINMKSMSKLWPWSPEPDTHLDFKIWSWMLSVQYLW